MSRKQKVYDAIKALEGPVPDKMTWRRIVQAAGYTAWRDAAGFYGGVYPSMVLNADGSRSMTAHGSRRAGSCAAAPRALYAAAAPEVRQTWAS